MLQDLVDILVTAGYTVEVIASPGLAFKDEKRHRTLTFQSPMSTELYQISTELLMKAAACRATYDLRVMFYIGERDGGIVYCMLPS
jgi:hypothetical protein